MARRVWRLAKAIHTAAPLDGEGARLYGSRWTSPGRRVVYLSTEIGCAALEVLVHIGRLALAPKDFRLIAVTVPESMWRSGEKVKEGDLVPDWRVAGASTCAAIGDAWLARPSHSALLIVPSAVVPGVANALFDPEHEDAQSVQVQSIEPFSFDPRLFRG